MTHGEKNARVGISLLAYNQGDYVDAAIQALKKQTYQDFEIFLVDDASDDGKTTEKLKKINYDKITKKFFFRENLGSAARRLEQYKSMKNEYFLDLCADDILAPEFLEKTVRFLDEHQDYGAVSVNIRLFREEISDYYSEHKFDEKKMILPFELARNQVLGSSLERRQAILDAKLDGEMMRYNDWERWISMMEAGWKIGLVPEFLFYYRQVDTSLSHSASIKDEMEIREKLLKKHAKSYQKYYKEVIINMEQAFLEVLDGKNWLEKQYENMGREIERLKKENEELKNRTIKEMIKQRIRSRNEK